MTLFAVCAEGQHLDTSATCRNCTVCSREKEEGIFIATKVSNDGFNNKMEQK